MDPLRADFSHGPRPVQPSAVSPPLALVPPASGVVAAKGSAQAQATYTVPPAEVPKALLGGTPVPDPFVIRAPEVQGGRDVLWMLGTSNETKETFPLYISRDNGVTWAPALDKKRKPLSIFPNLPNWVSTKAPDRWAPEVHRVDGKFVVFYSARHKDGDLRVAAGVADSMAGPWRDLGPVLKEKHGVIDATMTFDPKTRQNILVYKPDNNCVGEPTPILSRPFRLTDKTIEFTGPPHEIMRNQDGDEGVLEGPTLVSENGTNYIFVSSGVFSLDGYSTSCAELKDPAHGTAEGRRLLLHSGSPVLRGKWESPGHVSMVKVHPDRDDGLYHMYVHAWDAEKPRDGETVWKERFKPGIEGRMPLRLTVAFREPDGTRCAPYIVEERYPQGATFHSHTPADRWDSERKIIPRAPDLSGERVAPGSRYSGPAQEIYA